MTDQPASPSDLSSLGIDLAQSFVPAWAKETEPTERLARLAERGGEPESRGRSGGRRDGFEGRSARPAGRGGSPGGRGDARSGGRRNDRDRREGGRGRSEGGRTERVPRPAPAPVLEGWKLEFSPEIHGVEGITRQIKSGAKTYPLFSLAGLVLEKPERFRVVFKKAADPAEALFQVKIDGTVWLLERDAVAHVLARHRDKFYRTEKVTVDPPKGSHSVVAVCGMSGVLLGPPNVHDYPLKLLRLHGERFANVPFEVFKSRVRMERDEALVQKWKEEQSVREEFIPIDPAAPVPDPVASDPVAAVGAETPIAESPVPLESVAVEAAHSEVEEGAPAAEVSGAETVSEPAPAAAEVTPAEISADEPADSAEPSAGEPVERLATFADLEAHFRTHHAAHVVISIREKAVVSGPVAFRGSAGAVVERVRREWEELRRFPLALAHVLGRQFTARGLHLFKAHQKITYVAAARPRYLDYTSTPVAEGIRGILEYLEAHPQVARPDQWTALVALRSHLPEADREPALAKDLLWLLHQGHVLDFAGGRLEAARRPQPQPVREKKKPSAGELTPIPAGPQHEALPGASQVDEPEGPAELETDADAPLNEGAETGEDVSDPAGIESAGEVGEEKS